MPVIRYQEFLPHSVLQDYVKRFWILEKEYSEVDTVEEVLPDACVEMILNFGEPYSQQSSSGFREFPPLCLIGLLNKPLRLRASGLVRIVAVRFFAWSALAFLKTVARANGATKINLAPPASKLVQTIAALARAGEYQKAVEYLEDFLIGLRLNALFGSPQVRTAAKLLYNTKGQFRVAELADYRNLSMRQLQRKFEEATGVSPKTLARNIRFEEIRNRIMFDPDLNLTDLAYEFGYNDQSHFIKDFKAFTDRTPGEYAVESRNFQRVFRDHENVLFLQSLSNMPDYQEEFSVDN